eukprot:11866223-Heterocapsa_arctica.AAC.1
MVSGTLAYWLACTRPALPNLKLLVHGVMVAASPSFCALGPHDLDQPFRTHDVVRRPVVYGETVLPSGKAALEDL